MRRVILASLLAFLGRSSSREAIDSKSLDSKIDNANFGITIADKTGVFRLAKDEFRTLPLKSLFKEIAQDSNERASQTKTSSTIL